MMKMELQDKIDNYLLDRMSEDERRAFEKEMDGNEELQEQLGFTKNVRSVLVSRNEKLAKMKKWDVDEQIQVACRSRRTWVYKISGIAAVFIIGFFLFSTLFNNNNSLSGDYNNYNVIAPKQMSSDDVLSTEKNRKLLASIEEKEYEVLSELRMLTSRGANDVVSEEDKERMASLKKQLEELQWSRVTLMVELKDYKQALIVLEEIRQSESVYMEKADSLYHILIKMQ